MPKVDIKKQDPERYAIIKLKQETIKNQLNTMQTISLECPYCYHKIGRVFQGQHSGIECKCGNCGEVFIFPPLAFSRATV